MESKWLNVKEAAAYAGSSEETIRVALRRRQLKGAQRTKNANWRTQAEWIDAWLEGEEPVAA